MQTLHASAYQELQQLGLNRDRMALACSTDTMLLPSTSKKEKDNKVVCLKISYPSNSNYILNSSYIPTKIRLQALRFDSNDSKLYYLKLPFINPTSCHYFLPSLMSFMSLINSRIWLCFLLIGRFLNHCCYAAFLVYESQFSIILTTFVTKLFQTTETSAVDGRMQKGILTYK